MKSFVWAGPTVQQLTLGARSTHIIQQRACFVDAGVYNLGVLRVSAGGGCVSGSGADMVEQRPLSAAPIVIHQATNARHGSDLLM